MFHPPAHLSCIALLLLSFAPVAASQSDSVGDQLDQNVYEIFSQKCTRCHDEQPSSAGGDVDFLLDFVALADPSNYQFDGDDPAESRLKEVLIGDDPEMPKRQMKHLTWAGPLTSEELAAVVKWIERGGPSDEYRQQAARSEERSLITLTQLHNAISADQGSLEGNHLEHARYLTLTNLHNNNSVTSEQLETYRQAVVKMLNSLSSSTDVLGLDTSDAVQKLVAVDEARTVYRIDLRDIGWTTARWERIAQHYPYGIQPEDGLTRSIANATSSRTPFMRADWFVFVASQPPLYHDLLDIPDSLAALEKNLHVNRADNIRSGRAKRAGFGKSGVSVNNRLVERHASGVNGAYWISYDFGANTDSANLMENPLGPPGVLTTSRIFDHDGGEVIYSLPNGFQAYALLTGTGDRISVAPNTIVHDDSMTGGQIINGISCISCHFEGMKPENDAKLDSLDEVRRYLETGELGFTTQDRRFIEDLYPAQNNFARYVRHDRDRFLQALSRAGITRRGANEPVRSLFDHFAGDVNLETAAAGLSMSVEQFSQQMDREGETRRLLGRIQNQGLQRQAYTTSMARVVEVLGMGRMQQHQPLRLPFFGQNPDTGADRSVSSWIDAERRGGSFSMKMEPVSDGSVFTVGQQMECAIRSTQDGYLTLVAVAESGDISLLVPNPVHPSLKIEAGRRYLLPTPEMKKNGIAFEAMAPYGTTTIKAIATKRPLKIKGVTARTLKKSGLVYLGSTSDAATRAAINVTDQFKDHEWTTAQWTCSTRAK